MIPSQEFIQNNNADDNEEDSDVEEEQETGLEGTDQGMNMQLTVQSTISGISEDSPQQIRGNHCRESHPPREQYFITGLDSGSGSYIAVAVAAPPAADAADPIQADTVLAEAGPADSSVHRFLQLPKVPVLEYCRKSREEPLTDYSKSIMLTSNGYLQSMELKAARKEKARKGAEQRKVDAKKLKDARAAEKVHIQLERA
jgi:hypothetical protein